MKVNKGFGLIVTLLVFVSTLYPTGVFAQAERTIEDESIYDLLVDRYNNGDGTNDIDVDVEDGNAFNGGDFAGIAARLEHITKMGFTMISLGPIFSTESYDGSKVLDYTKLESRFGTDKDFAAMHKAVQKQDLAIIADFPFGGVSANHVWAQEGTAKFTPAADGTIDWDTADQGTQQALKTAVVDFMQTAKLDGIRLTKISHVDTAFINEVIAAVKEVNPDAYVLTNETSDADFDITPSMDKMAALKQSFVRTDADTSPLALFDNPNKKELIQFDELTGPRFTYEMVEARMYPPTRWKVAAAGLFTLPGIPVLPYASEIAVNGKEAPESHPLTNFKTDMELADFIGGLNSLRNQSEALRNGDFEMLHNKDGFTVYKRSNDKETWIIALNNTSETANVEIPKEIIGENKKLRGVLDNDLIRESKDGVFRVVLERELAEIYIADEDTGYNTPYLIASILIYVLFFAFLFKILRKGRQAKRARVAK